MTASFDPEKVAGLDVTQIISLNDIPPSPRLSISPSIAAALGLETSCCKTATATKDLTTTTQAACTGSISQTGSSIAKTDSTIATVKVEQPTKAKTWTFSISIGDAHPLQLKGTITQTESSDPVPAKP